LAHFFLGDVDGVEEFLPLLGGCQEDKYSSQWPGASKDRATPQYIEFEMQSRP
jgi:hypothetical protein